MLWSAAASATSFATNFDFEDDDASPAEKTSDSAKKSQQNNEDEADFALETWKPAGESSLFALSKPKDDKPPSSLMDLIDDEDAKPKLYDYSALLNKSKKRKEVFKKSLDEAECDSRNADTDYFKGLDNFEDENKKVLRFKQKFGNPFRRSRSKKKQRFVAEETEAAHDEPTGNSARTKPTELWAITTVLDCSPPSGQYLVQNRFLCPRASANSTSNAAGSSTLRLDPLLARFASTEYNHAAELRARLAHSLIL